MYRASSICTSSTIASNATSIDGGGAGTTTTSVAHGSALALPRVDLLDAIGLEGEVELVAAPGTALIDDLLVEIQDAIDALSRVLAGLESGAEDVA